MPKIATETYPTKKGKNERTSNFPKANTENEVEKTEEPPIYATFGLGST